MLALFLLFSDKQVLARYCRGVLQEKGRLKRRGMDKKREKGEEGRELVCVAHRAQRNPFNPSPTSWVGCASAPVHCAPVTA